MTNDATIKERVERCRKALTGYSDDDRFLSLIDFLADAMHWCDANGEDFHYALAWQASTTSPNSTTNNRMKGGCP